MRHTSTTTISEEWARAWVLLIAGLGMTTWALGSMFGTPVAVFWIGLNSYAFGVYAYRRRRIHATISQETTP